MTFKRILVWLSRIRYVRGFGVQSPSAYRFIRYVINEHYPYYAYLDLKSVSAQLDDTRQRLYKLYFRLSNFMQVTTWTDLRVGNDGVVQKFIHAGAKKTQYSYCEDGSSVESFELLRLHCQHVDASECVRLLSIASPDSLLIVEGIHLDKQAKDLWLQIVENDQTAVTYDLYDCGLVFFDKQKFKTNYIVNF